MSSSFGRVIRDYGVLVVAEILPLSLALPKKSRHAVVGGGHVNANVA
jgi:hypothetical protein